jgi:hypothetical protein
VSITLDLPPPISVNDTRRVDWKGHRKAKEWMKEADKFLLVAKSRKEVRFDRIPRYELLITLSEDHCAVEVDNSLKTMIDYLRYRDIVEDDGKANIRKLTVEWGHAPAGARVVITPIEGE